ncbi:hypothetical protein D3C87_1661910 [compost metagenome]
MHQILHAGAEAFPGMMEDLAAWLVGTGLFRSDDAVDVATKLGHVSSNDGIISIGDDRQAETCIF